MWALKLRVTHDDWILSKTVTFKVKAHGSPLNSYLQKGVRYYNSYLIIQGEQRQVKRFIESVKNDKRVINVESHGNQIFVLSKEKENIAPFLDKKIFFLKPILFEDGCEYWHLASWEKSPLIKFYEKTNKHAEVKILRLGQESPSMFVQHALPHLSQKQLESIRTAIAYGYYSYPRKESVQSLSKKINLKRTTFQEHLRKAESKIIQLLLYSLEESKK